MANGNIPSQTVYPSTNDLPDYDLTVRICIVGDEGVGKSSLLAALVQDSVASAPLQPVLPPITLPPTLGTPENVTTTIVDTSALPQERTALRRELRKCNVILLVYGDHYSYERVALFWLPYFRSMGVNVPVVLCANKADLAAPAATTARVVSEELMPVLAEFKEVDACIRTSSREHYNVNEVFFLCQKAVTHPIAPLYDSKEGNLKPAAIDALRRVFYLCDKDQDGLWSDKEVHAFQMKCFERPLADEDLASIKRAVLPDGDDERTVPHGIDVDAFLTLNRMFAEKGRHETIWIILRKFRYSDGLSLKEDFLHPKFDIPAFASAELSPAGFRFFVDLFLSHDKDNDGGLSDVELATLFAPTPGLPPSWTSSDFPNCTVRNDAGQVTLQGWLAQWSMTTLEEPRTTLEYLAYLGFESPDGRGTTSALKLTKSRNRRRTGRVERSVFLCYVLGAAHSGKSALLDSFLQRPGASIYQSTTRPRKAINSVELSGGKQCYLILEELGALEPAVLGDSSKLAACDLVCFTYDSSDPDSFAYVRDLRASQPALASLPTVFAALKADADRAVQRSDIQPEAYCEALRLPKPRHVSVAWASIGEFFVHLAECATFPAKALPQRSDEDAAKADRFAMYIVGISATVCAGAALAWIWRRNAMGSADV